VGSEQEELLANVMLLPCFKKKGVRKSRDLTLCDVNVLAVDLVRCLFKIKFKKNVILK